MIREKFQRGLTLIELLVAIGILTLLFSITTISLLRSQRSFTQAAFVDSMLTDFRDQQTKAMSQDTDGDDENNDFGIYLTASSYTLFRGTTYVANDPQNFTVTLDPSLSLASIDLPSSSIVFASGSGQMVGYVATDSTFNVRDETNGEIITVTLNRYGIPLD